MFKDFKENHGNQWGNIESEGEGEISDRSKGISLKDFADQSKGLSFQWNGKQ